MNKCFENYITLEGLSPEIPPRSKLYINDLPGVTLAMFTGLMDEDQSDIEEYWESLYRRSVANFIDEVSIRMNQEFYVDKVIDSQRSGVVIKPVEVNLTEEIQAGVLIEVIKTRYSTTEIQTIDIFSVGSPASKAKLRIIDDETNQVLWSKVVDLLVEVNTVDVFENFDCQRLRVVYDTDQVYSYQTVRYKDDNSYYGSTKICDPCTYQETKVTQLNGGGLIVDFLTKCSIDLFVCSQLSRFKGALWYYIGYELMIDAIHSKNVNCFTIDREEAERLRDYFWSEIDKKLNNAINHLKINDDWTCFNCKGTISKVTVLP